MIELLEFIFRSGWTFAGFAFLFILFIGLVEEVFSGISKIVLVIKTTQRNDKTNQNRTDNI